VKRIVNAKREIPSFVFLYMEIKMEEFIRTISMFNQMMMQHGGILLTNFFKRVT